MSDIINAMLDSWTKPVWLQTPIDRLYHNLSIAILIVGAILVIVFFVLLESGRQWIIKAIKNWLAVRAENSRKANL